MRGISIESRKYTVLSNEIYYKDTNIDTDLASDAVIDISLDDLDLESSLVTDTHCRYYLQGRCKHGGKGVTVNIPIQRFVLST